MKTPYLLALLSAVALAIASVLSAEAAIAFFALIGVMAIAVVDYAREPKPLMAVAARPVAETARSTHALRLAA
ncbi:MAG: hypothetical protein EXS39_04760 [Opitutaceae bacterium]|nr:hypothetical protein [Opitutaceae bacterium]